MDIPRHKVFISYYHNDDQQYKNYLINMCEVDSYTGREQSIFDDYSVRERDIDDANLPAERIRCIIRDEYIRDATVLILLCGKNTRYRKHIDWEIHAAMFDTDKNPQMGILVINLPTISQWIRASSEEEKSIISNNDEWFSLDTRSDFESHYPYIPSRIIDNFVKGAPITVVEWDKICGNPRLLKILIDNAFKRRNQFAYDISAPLRKSNS